MQKENYEKAKTKQFEKYRAISLYTLLATQDYEEFIARMIDEKKWKIERELDLI